MNIMHQIYVGLLSSILVATCLATEHRQFYEVLHEQENIFNIEDYHADLVLGMLPNIKTSIKDFRKRNFTNIDIENMYQTLTIFWPVVRKYLHLKEEFVDNEPSEGKENDIQNSNSNSSENIKVPSKNNVVLDNIQTRSKIEKSRISQSSPLVYKKDHPISSQIDIHSSSTNENQRAMSNPKTSVLTPSKNVGLDNIQTRSKIGKSQIAQPWSLVFKKNQPIVSQIELNSTSTNKDQRAIYNPKTSASTPSTNKQNINGRKYAARFKSIRESSSTSDDKISIQSNFQSARTTPITNNSAIRRPYKSTSNKYFSTTTARPSRQPAKLIHFDPISTTEESPLKSTSNKPFSYTTRRPYRKTYKPISQDFLSTAVKRLLQSTGSTITRNNSANGRPYKSISNKPFSTTRKIPSRRPFNLISQNTKSTTEEAPISTRISTPVLASTTTRRPSRRPANLLSRDSLSPGLERFLQLAVKAITQTNRANERPYKPTSNNPFSTTTRRPSRRPSKLINSDPISTAKESPLKSISNRPFSYTTRRPYRRTYKLTSQDSLSTTEEIPTPTTVSTPVLSSANIRRPSNLLSQDSVSTQEERPFASLYHNLLRTSAIRLLQTATHNPATANISKSTRTTVRSKSARTGGRSISTTISTPFPDSTTDHTVSKYIGTAVRSKHTRTVDRSISTTIATPVPALKVSRTPSKTITSSSTLAPDNMNARNSATDVNGATDKSPVEYSKLPINEDMFIYTDLSSIIKAIGNPIDLTNLTG